MADICGSEEHLFHEVGSWAPEFLAANPDTFARITYNSHREAAFDSDIQEWSSDPAVVKKVLICKLTDFLSRRRMGSRWHAQRVQKRIRAMNLFQRRSDVLDASELKKVTVLRSMAARKNRLRRGQQDQDQRHHQTWNVPRMAAALLEIDRQSVFREEDIYRVPGQDRWIAKSAKPNQGAAQDVDIDQVIRAKITRVFGWCRLDWDCPVFKEMLMQRLIAEIKAQAPLDAESAITNNLNTPIKDQL